MEIIFVILIAFVVIKIASIVMFIKSKKETKEVIKVYTGTIGSGKTYRAVTGVIRSYKFCNLLYKLHLIKGIPRIYSNIPLYLGKKFDVYVLQRDHLLCKEKFPDNVCPIVLIDEIGLIANQYSYDDPNVQSRNINESWQTLDTFIRFFRQFYGANNHDHCRLYLTDQAVGGMNISIRRRLGVVNYLYSFRRWFMILPYYIVNTKEMITEEDTLNTNNVDIKDKDKQYYFGKLPYRFVSKILKRKPTYDSHCFRNAILNGFVSKLDYSIWPKDSLETNYCPDIRMSDQERIEHKKLRKKLDLLEKSGGKTSNIGLSL